MRRALALLSAAAVLAATPLHAAEPIAPAQATTVELSAAASQSAPNDLATAVLYVERNGPNPAAVAREVNRDIAAALETARTRTDVKVQSGNTATWPVYAQDGKGRITAWRMRSEIQLESRNLAAMSELVGELQSSLALAQISMQPAPETRRKAVDEATVDALRAFEQRAALIAGALGKKHRIAHLAVGDSGFQPPMPRMRAAAMSAEVASAPLEGGESEVSVHVSGRIELLD
ncbi:SIMPL domain-containing protein [Thauera sp.]|jgi:predicted secreted protein|uniref:SIMPL domain-containing protein n=1 Tax=Thauera sp. TaxID=1905334 RepID=UPI002A35B57E|nr:SIMPL domain-containing protein [Thauera sp.]MDX9884761.1 SIMPL domain-containing protein [Thauera sp.]